jgi:hypothetical protein
MKNLQNGFAGISIVLLIALIAAGGGVYIYSQKKTGAPFISSVVDSVKFATNTSSDEHMDGIYKDDPYDFQFNYPPGLKITNLSKDPIEGGPHSTSLKLRINSPDYTMDVYVDKNSSSCVLAKQLAETFPENSDQITINNQVYTRYLNQSYSSSGNLTSALEYTTQKDGVCFDFKMYNSSLKTKITIVESNNYFKELDELIKSIQFN